MVCTSDIAAFYAGRSIFITGATGFMGKVLVEKLLRDCPEIREVFILVRPKHGKNTDERIQEFVSSPAFNQLHENQPNFQEKIKPIAGDILLPGLGISGDDLALLIKSVTVVFHTAATVRFDEHLKKAMDMNVKGVGRMMAVCNKLENLEVLVHVSTAFVNLLSGQLNEELCPPIYDPDKLCLLVDSLEENKVESATNGFLKDLPNTYTLAKILGELKIMKEQTCFPVAIVRPSIVTGAWKEPMAGWTDSLNGPGGLSAGYSGGLIGSVLGDPSKKADFIPVDMATNLMISAAWYTVTHKPGSVEIYTIGTSDVNTITWKGFADFLIGFDAKYPYSKALMPRYSAFRKNQIVHHLYSVLFHYLPAYGIDIFRRSSGQKPFMVRMYQKIDKSVGCLKYYTLREWTTKCDNTLVLSQKMNEGDRETFNCDPRTIDWEDYFNSYVLGVRRYILKDDDLTIPMARSRTERMKNIRTIVMTVVCLFASILLYKMMQSFDPLRLQGQSS